MRIRPETGDSLNGKGRGSDVLWEGWGENQGGKQ